MRISRLIGNFNCYQIWRRLTIMLLTNLTDFNKKYKNINHTYLIKRLLCTYMQYKIR